MLLSLLASRRTQGSHITLLAALSSEAAVEAPLRGAA